MDDIRLVIKNPSNVKYKCIVLRKFFYMIFIDADGRKLSMYIATVFGGTKIVPTDAMEAYKSIQNDDSVQCCLKFDYSLSSGVVEKVNIQDITDSFFKQKKYIEAVWGNCTEMNDQKSVSKELIGLYPILYSNGIEAAVDVDKRYYLVEEGTAISHKFIATEGDFRLSPGTGESRAYELSCPKANTGECLDGLEAMNWIKIEMDLKSSILTKPVNFTIEFDKGTIYTPDFTWYFAPPAGHIVSSESYVKIGKRKEQNAIQSVSDETTVYFNEWTKTPESIQERKKSRIIFKQAGVEDIATLSKNGTVTVSLHLDNPKGPSNRQFFMGLLVAFILSFCSDKTRMNDYFSCLSNGCTRLEGGLCLCEVLCNVISILAPILLLGCFFSFIMEPKEAIPSYYNKYSRFLSICRFWGIVATVVFVLYIYVLWLIIPTILRAFLSCWTNMLIIVITMGISLAGNLIYLFACLAIFKRKIYNFM